MGKLDHLFGGKSSPTAANLGQRPEGHQLSVAKDEERSVDNRYEGTRRVTNGKFIRLDRIQTKSQVRKHFNEEELQQLAVAIEEFGQDNAITVYWSDEDEVYTIKAGERRYRAAQIAGWEEIRCDVVEAPVSEVRLVEYQLVENLQRSDLNPIEEAQSYKTIQELNDNESALHMSKRLGKDQTTISRALRLLKLPQNIQDDISEGKLPISIAREILKLKEESKQQEMATRYHTGELTTEIARAESCKKNKSSKRTAAKTNKKWTVDGIGINVSYPRGATLASVADALEQKVHQLRADKRTVRAAA